MTRYSSTMTEALQEIREGFSSKQIKMAIGIASDKRYAGGNMTGAVQAIEKIKKGLADHPQVAAVLKRQNEDLEEGLDLDELKMDDPKLVKHFDKLKRGDTVKLKTSSTISKGTDFVDYVVKAKNTVNKGRVEKITLVTKGNEKAVKKFLYKRDGKVTFAIGDMGASIDDIKEGFFSKEYEPGQYKNGDEKPFVDAIKKAGGKNIEVQKPTRRDPMLTIEFDGDAKKAQKEVSKVGDGTEEIDEKLGKNADAGDYIDDFKKSDAPQFKGKSDKKKKDMAIAAYLDAKDKKEEVELDELKEPFVVVDTADGNKVVGTASSEKGAKEIITTAQLPPMKIKDKKTLKIVKSKKKQRLGDPIKEGTWHIPDSPKLKSGLKKLMSKPIKLGKDGDDATDRIGHFIGDDELYDALFVAGKKNPNGDARDVIKKAMKRLGIKEEDEKKPDKPDSAKAVDQARDDKKKTRIAQLQLQIAKATETINKLNSQEKPDA